MKQILRFTGLVVLLGLAFHFLRTLGSSADSPFVARLWDCLHQVPYISVVIGHPNMTVSAWITVIMLAVGFMYLLVHLLELLIKGTARLFGRVHPGLETKKKVRSFFYSALIVKGALVLLQVGILVTQAWSISRFLHGIIEDPQSFYQVLRADVIFIGILLLLLMIRMLESSRHVELENG